MKYCKKITFGKNNAAYKEFIIDDSLSETAKTAQIEIITADGYLPVQDSEHPVIDFRKQRLVQKYEDVLEGDTVVAYKKTYSVIEMPIRINRTKLLSHPQIADKIDALKAIISTDAILKNWWINEMTYVKGSEAANAALEKFGFTEEELEAIVRACAM